MSSINMSYVEHDMIQKNHGDSPNSFGIKTAMLKF